MIPDHVIKKFQRIYKEYFGEEISREMAVVEGIKLLNLVRLMRELNAEKGPEK